MRLSEINPQNLQDEDIQTIVYSDISDNGKSTKYGLVFGNSMLIKERVTTAWEAYHDGRIQKVILTGGTAGVSNQEHDLLPEAIKMKNLAIEMGILEQDILVEDTSSNSFENVEHAFPLIPEKIDSIALISSEFHLKRCLAIIQKKYPTLGVILIHSRDGFSDSDNWFLSDGSWNSGRSLATYEANLLIRYAKEGKIADLDIAFDKKRVYK